MRLGDSKMSNINYDDYFQRANRAKEKVHQNIQKKLVELAGEQALLMIQNPDVAANFLNNNLPNIQRAAIIALALHWQISPEMDSAKKIYQMALHENNPDVRYEALEALGIIYQGSDNIEIGAFLANTALNEQLDTVIRKKAFLGLCFLRCAIKESWAIRTFPVGIDWSFVKSFLDISRVSKPSNMRISVVKYIDEIRG
jgi:hypothetical protein